eukprot:Plantae.Rhodophyta-Rhodochaete_pulchella.ctg13.p1 GENE.Plantae.Rhodophyta-Rhodochaete_pulchella.ctg13~~Plantae.Rhodophyta-Rhodochaete_pulchella.ctg13.p1  ORF type:complete len:295 (-),score=42.59 Plantae.Rhodophyta-Rhodochaete_pulchella.ctg13:367-1251(-)
MAPAVPSAVVVHPIVLLGVVDHYNRSCKDTNRRAVGILLGSVSKGKAACTNSFAVPFEEDEKDPSVWFLDHNYLENMLAMFRKVNAHETVLGWYSTGPKIRPGDLDIHELIRRYTPHPVFVIVDAKPKELGLPTEAYFSVMEPKEDASVARTFQHLPSEITAADAEEVGVGHLLRDVKDSSTSTLSAEVSGKMAAVQSLTARLRELQAYLQAVADGRLPINHEVMYNMQAVFNLLPSFDMGDMTRSFAVKTNDMTLVLYLSSLIRGVIALHNLVDNKLVLRDAERRTAEAAEAS